ncbi:MAG: DMT family transporter [Deltaproteobacteria bacterium]|nr:DMT family transporter [Deltaproteobacteria bacterium]
MNSLKPYVVMSIGVAAISFAAIFIRLADAPSLVVAAGRLTIASVILIPLSWSRIKEELKGIHPRDILIFLLSGTVLAFHFAVWIASLSYTSVAASVVLVTTNPIFVALASFFFLREHISRLQVIGIGLSVAGGMVIGGGEAGGNGHALYGDLLALLGALLMTFYLLAGRRLRQRFSLLTYISVVYGMAAVLLLGMCLITGASFYPYSGWTYLMLVLLALGPQLIGHSSFNWALRHVTASFVAVAILGEPVGATLLAYLILGETLLPSQWIGGSLVLIGIYLCARGESNLQAPG